MKRLLAWPWVSPVLAGIVAVASCSHEWPAYRYSFARTGAQPYSSALSDTSRVGSLARQWTFTPPSATDPAPTFSASPIVMNDVVYIGSMSGHFYAIDAVTGAMKWQYPVPPAAPLVATTGAYVYGIQSSAVYWDHGPNGTIIFGAQDPALGPFGSARLFGLDAKLGTLIWQSDPVAQITGGTWCSATELHERIGYSSPLLFNGMLYVGVADNGDSPIQQGKVVAVQLSDGHISPGFNYASVASGARGGGVWNSAATDLSGVFFTTGNSRADNCASYQEPSPNHGLSMIRVDKDTGSVIWGFQPVPFSLDCDPDWSAGATVMSTSCGTLVASVQKDGYTYAVNAGNGSVGPPSVAWQFPATGFPFTGSDLLCQNAAHGDTDYKRPGAAWNDVLVITAGGEAVVHTVTTGYTQLHALNACATNPDDRVRWLLDVPHASAPGGNGYSVGAPTVSGGIVYVGTNQGHLVVLADPSIVPAAGTRCRDATYPDVPSCCAALCAPGTCGTTCNPTVPIPQVLADVDVPGDGSSIAGMRNEPVLAKGRVFVAATTPGHGRVFMLEPGPPSPPPNACGGTATLYAVPGATCEEAGQCGRWTCLGPNANAVTCNTSSSARNQCGGCNPLPIPESGYGRGSHCFCSNGADEGVLVCGPPRNGVTPLICCPCSSAPGCGPGSP